MIFACIFLLGQAPAPTRFVDVSAAVGASIANDQACWADLNRDGWSDLVAGGVVWRNDGGKRFERLAEGVGSVVAADFDNDGFTDLYSWTTKKLLRNEKGERFTEVPLPEVPPSVSCGASWGDFDNDARVDLYVGGYEDWDKGLTYPSYILMNRGPKGFEVAWTEAKHRTRGVTVCDFDRNGAVDVYASNYRLQPNQLWRNDGKGRFVDAAVETNSVATSTGFGGGHSIGSAWGDFDADGEFDLFAGNFAHVDSRGDQPKSRFLRNLGRRGGYKFEDLGERGIRYQESYASPAAGDVDNDGHLDLFFTTVYAKASFSKPNNPVLYQGQGKFSYQETTVGSGLEGLPPTYQAAFADFRNDGRLGLCTGGKLFSQVAEAKAGHWLGVRLEGDGKRVNRDAIGAQVRIKLKGTTLTRQVEAGTGQGNQNELKLHFGLGDWRDRVSLEVTWPGGMRQTVRRVKIDQIVNVRFRG